MIAEALELPVSVASHVDAMAAAELLLGMRRFGPNSSTSLYVYARETVGYALMIDGRVHSPASGPGTITNLPAHSELLGGSGLLESTVSDEAVLAAARRLRILPAHNGASGGSVTEVLKAARSGNQQAQELLTSGPGCSANRSRCCVTCSTPTTWWSAVRHSPNTPRA